MPDLKTRLSALMIEFRYTRSQRVLNEVKNVLRNLEDLGRPLLISEESLPKLQP